MDSINIKATIIILSYNQKETIRRAIESVLAQKCNYKFEILIADDGSEDGTREICEDYVNNHPDIIRIMPRVPNKGIVDNYFDALLEAKGEYIGDCAGDDEWIGENRLQFQIEALDNDSSASAVCTNVVIRNNSHGTVKLMRGGILKNCKSNQIIKVRGECIIKSVLNHTKLTTLPYMLSAALYRRIPIIRLLQNSPDIIRCYDGGVEDTPLIAALGDIGDTIYLPIVGYLYIINGQSASNNLPLDKEYAYVAGICSMVRRLGKEYGLSIKDQKAFFDNKFIYLAALVRNLGDNSLLKDFNHRLNEWHCKLPLRGKFYIWIFKIHNLIKRFT